MHTGIRKIPVCVRGDKIQQSPYAYENFSDPRMYTGTISVTNCMHNEFVRIWGFGGFVPICKILHMGITVCVRRVPIRIRAGIAKIRIWGNPLLITNLCAYGD